MLRGRELGRQSKSRIFGIFVSCRLSLVDLGPPHAPYPCFMAASASVLGLFQRPLMLFARWLEQMPLPLCSPGQSAVGRPLNVNVYFRGFCGFAFCALLGKSLRLTCDCDLCAMACAVISGCYTAIPIPLLILLAMRFYPAKVQ